MDEADDDDEEVVEDVPPRPPPRFPPLLPPRPPLLALGLIAATSGSCELLTAATAAPLTGLDD